MTDSERPQWQNKPYLFLRGWLKSRKGKIIFLHLRQHCMLLHVCLKQWLEIRSIILRKSEKSEKGEVKAKLIKIRNEL